MTLRLVDIVHRQCPPAPWSEGDNIPWNDADFSERMLKEHLSQEHDAASRRLGKIDEQVAWIHGELLGERPTRILDITCGPGLYTLRLAGLGHECVGIDYAPAAIAHAVRRASREGRDCTYVEQDVREARFGEGFGLAMMLWGQFNVFSRGDARGILAKAHAALAEGGLLLLEAQTHETVKSAPKVGRPSWTTAPSGLFSDRPHLLLEEGFWDEDAQAYTERWHVIDAETGEVRRHALSNQAYRVDEFRSMLEARGFMDIRTLPSLVGVEDESQSMNMVIVARKRREP